MRCGDNEEEARLILPGGTGVNRVNRITASHDRICLLARRPAAAVIELGLAGGTKTNQPTWLRQLHRCCNATAAASHPHLTISPIPFFLLQQRLRKWLSGLFPSYDDV